MTHRLDWLYAICPYCGVEYGYLKARKLTTCGKSDCIYKHLHPNLYPKPNIPHIIELAEKQRMEK